MGLDMMVSKCSTNHTSSFGKRKHLAQNVLEKKNKHCLRDADGHQLSPYELFPLLKIERNNSYLMKLGLDGNSVLKRESVCKERSNKLMSNRQESKDRSRKLQL